MNLTTYFQIFLACMQSQTGKLYSLGSLWFYLTHKEFSDYFSKALEEKIELINAVDKEKINQYFSSNKDEDLDIIDQNSRTKTFLLIGRKRQSDQFETVINDDENIKNLFSKASYNENVKYII